MAYEWENSILPEFPKTEHLPSLGHYAPNASSDDRVASAQIASIVNGNVNVYVEEKLDAANSGICHYDGQPIIRNRNHVLRKGYGRKRTNAKLQFAPIWNWYYESVEKFERLNDALGFYASVYGEWMYFTGTIFYDKLPAYFVAYDIWDSEERCFLPPTVTRAALERVGFAVPPLLQIGVKSYDELVSHFVQSAWAAAPELQSRPGNALREGVYLKVFDENKITHRFKMVRQGFLPGENFTGHRNLLNKHE
jgi:hypothetical protein